MADEMDRVGEITYTVPLARALLRDRRLSWGAKGLFAFLWDCPRGWRPKVAHLQKMGPEGRDAVRAKLEELERVGAVRKEPLFDLDEKGEPIKGGKIRGSRWLLFAPDLWAIESPLGGAEVRVSRNSELPTVEKSATKVHQQDSPPKTREEQQRARLVDKIRSMGILIENAEDLRNAEKLVVDIDERFDLIRNAVAVVRARAEKNRPYLSSVACVARSLFAEERLADVKQRSKARVTDRGYE